MSVTRFPLTPQGLEKLKKELDFLKSVERPRLINEIETARAHGDLRENAEYHAAREKMGFVKGRIEDLDAKISLAEVINPLDYVGQTRVMFGATVTLTDMEDASQKTYQLVGEEEADLAQNRISISSPIGRSLINRNLGDEVAVRTPKGQREFEIVKVEYK